MNKKALKLCIIAGEVSGDAHAASVLRELTKKNENTEVYGIGGSSLKSAGMRVIFPMEELSVIGIAEAIFKLPIYIRAKKSILDEIKRNPPDALILIDFPDFNISVGSEAAELKIPVIYYISPQIWAWRRNRLKNMKKFVDCILTILPFEAEIYQKAGLRAEYVGHPLVTSIKTTLSRGEFLIKWGIKADKRTVAILPGSRYSEVSKILPKLLKSAEIVNDTFGDIEWIMPLSPQIRKDEILKYIPKDMNLKIVLNDYYETISYSDCAVVASGTATLETALIGCPFLMVYHLNPITYAIASRLVKLNYVALPNIILNEGAVREYIQRDFTPQNVAGEIIRILSEDPYRNKMKERLNKLKDILGHKNASSTAANAILSFLEERGINPPFLPPFSKGD